MTCREKCRRQRRRPCGRRLVSFGSRPNEIGETRSSYAELTLAQLLSRGHAVFLRRTDAEHVADRDLPACGKHEEKS